MVTNARLRFRPQPGAGAPDRATSRLELALFAAFAGISLWVLAVALLAVARHGDVWTGTDGIAAQDQMQYLAWVRDVAGHGLASNRFVLEPRPHDYIQPLLAVSGALTAIGMAAWLSVLLWKPVVVVACFLAVSAFVRATVSGTRARAAALALALFFTGWGALLDRVLGGSDDSLSWWAVTAEMWIPFSTWGYTFTVAAFAAMVGALVCYARDRGRGDVGWAAPLLGAAATWLHPWQGQTLIVVLLGAEALLGREGVPARWRRLVVTLGATAAPLVYYGVLSRTDVSWRLASAAGHRTWPLWIVAASVAPLALPALLGYRGRPRTFLAAATRAWPVAALAVFLVDQLLRVDGEIHALLGVGVPLGVLTVTGVQSSPWARRVNPAVAAALVLVLLVPPVVDLLRTARSTLHAGHGGDNAMFVKPGERAALEWLDRAPSAGGVLTHPYLGTAVPGLTGRSTWVGNTFWTPDFFPRAEAVARLMQGMSPPAAQRFVRSTGARFVLADCRSPADLAALLGPIVRAQVRFGCARVVEVRSAR
jgi:hypothetical protein